MIQSIFRKFKMIPIDADDWFLGILTVLIIGYLFFNPEDLDLKFKIVLGALTLYVVLSIAVKVRYRKLGIVESYSHKLGYPHNSWPILPIEGFISGRPALESDIRIGDAVFTLENSRSLDIELPQYALFVNSENEIPLVAIQGEGLDNEEILGFVNLHSGELQYDLSGNIKLLGNVKPTEWPPLKERGKYYNEPRGFTQVTIYLVLLFSLFLSMVFGMFLITGIIQNRLIAVISCLSLFGVSWLVTNKIWPRIKSRVF